MKSSYLCHLRSEGKQRNVRDVNRAAYEKAFSHLLKFGVTAIVFGEDKIFAFNENNKLKKKIDLNFTDLELRKLEVALVSKCEFFIGTSSGPAYLPILFNKKTLFTNWFPAYNAAPGQRSIILPKG